MIDIAVRPFDSGSDADARAAWRLRAVAFGSDRGPDDPPPGWTAGWHGWVAGDPVVGFARAYPFRQFWGGAPVPTGGLASVAVAPHARGRGVASALLRAAVPAMRAAGQPLCSLFPSVPGLYRAHGWEHVGVLESVDLATSALQAALRGAQRATATLRPATAADVPALLACYRVLAADVDGLLDRDDLPHVATADIAIVAADDRGVRGFVCADRGAPGLAVRDLVALDADAAVALLGTLASWSGALHDVRAQLTDSLALLPAPYPASVSAEQWMLRVVDLPAAVAARGWPRAALLRPGLAVDLDVVDDLAPWHAGRWRLAVSADGGVTCERGPAAASDVVTIPARGLAAWYAGTPSSALRRAGLLTGGPTGVLDALTGAGGPARLADSF